MKKRHPNQETCPCGSGTTYEACCQRWHIGPRALQAPEPGALMRSRYCAFVMNLTDYLLATWHADTRPVAIEPNPSGTRWLGLEIRRETMQDVDHGTVEFVARRRLNGRADRLHEVSRFVREGGRWFYLDGDFPKG